MNVCVLTHTFPRNKEDSAAAFMKEFCDGLVEAGAKVSVVIPYDLKFNRVSDNFKIITYKYIWPISFHLLGYSRTMNKDVSLRKRAYFLLPLMLIFGTLALYRTVKKEKIDIINVHWILPNGLMALIVSYLTKVPYVITLPGTDVYLAYKYKIFGFVARFIARRSSGIISNSLWHLDRMLKIGVKGVKTAVYGYPVDTLYFKPIKKGLDKYLKMHGLKDRDFIILAVGRLV